MREGASISLFGHWANELALRLTATPGVRVVFEHTGPVDHTRLEALIAQAEAHSLLVKDGVSLRKRLFNVLVEGLENVHHHTPADLAATGFALLVQDPEGYRVMFGNAVPAVSAELLAQRVEILNQMDEADLREYYLKLLANQGRTERGGAGLGLLTMARKSSGPIFLHKGSSDGSTIHVALELSLAAN